MQQMTISRDDRAQANHDGHPVKNRVQADRQPEGSCQKTCEYQEDIQQHDKEEERESSRIETDFQQVECTEDHSRHQGCHPNWAAFAQVLEEVAPEADFFAHTKRQAQEQAIDEEGQRTGSPLGANDLYPASGRLESKHQRDDQDAEYYTTRDIKQTLVKGWESDALP